VRSPELILSRQQGSEPLISLHHVGKTYPNSCSCLVDLDLQVHQGDFLFITGASGAGKSTLLKLLYGAEVPSYGEVFFAGQPVHKLKGDRLARLRRSMGIVFQDYKLIENRTIGENVAFVLWAQGYPPAEIQRRLRPTLNLVGLEHKIHSFPRQLSGGEQQRVSLARAIINTPSLILADEPTGNLDPENSRLILQLLQQMNDLGATVVVTTHDQSLVKMSQQPVMELYRGKLFWVRK